MGGRGGWVGRCRSSTVVVVSVGRRRRVGRSIVGGCGEALRALAKMGPNWARRCCGTKSASKETLGCTLTPVHSGADLVKPEIANGTSKSCSSTVVQRGAKSYGGNCGRGLSPPLGASARLAADPSDSLTPLFWHLFSSLFSVAGPPPLAVPRLVHSTPAYVARPLLAQPCIDQSTVVGKNRTNMLPAHPTFH